jgi:hypothetical protein
MLSLPQKRSKIMTTIEQMVNEFQCPGCTCGSDTQNCNAYKLENLETAGGQRCANHSAGTIAMGLGFINLGLPKGFCRVRKPYTKSYKNNYTNIRLIENPQEFKEDKFNVAVWAMEKDGYLFIRTYSPRIDATFVDIVKDGTLALVPNAIDVKNVEMD